MSLVYSADKNSDSVEWNTDAEVSVEYLTLQPGETDSAVNLNWYAPTGTEKAIVEIGESDSGSIVWRNFIHRQR